MKERGIIFSTEMVRAIQEGRKTQTRRVIKEPVLSTAYKDDFLNIKCGDRYINCPYGHPGDLLYAKETYFYDEIDKKCYYKALAESSHYEDYDPSEWKWKPSIFMPKKYARIWLEIINIQVERLQDINNSALFAEGILGANPFLRLENFIKLWDSINKKCGYDWETNPWVWVIEFKRIDK